MRGGTQDLSLAFDLDNLRKAGYTSGPVRLLVAGDYVGRTSSGDTGLLGEVSLTLQ